MRKMAFYAFASAAALVMTGIPTTAYAASGVNGNQKMIVIGGNFAFPGYDQYGMNNPSMVIPPMNNPEFWCSDVILPDFDFPDVSEQPDENDGSEWGNETGDAFEDQVVKLVNEERAKAGLPTLTQDASAGRAADIRAREVESTFSHTRPDGRTFSTALSEEGIRYSGAGENIAYGQNSPEQVMQGWMNSAGHRANILNGNFKNIGVGHYRNAAGVDYWTQLFFN